jgi:hypothetical protein
VLRSVIKSNLFKFYVFVKTRETLTWGGASVYLALGSPLRAGHTAGLETLHDDACNQQYFEKWPSYAVSIQGRPIHPTSTRQLPICEHKFQASNAAEKA